ncbi:YhcN/YlaJ family sporulation lipoprotein [Alkalibacillus haloalkaliphilus]|uniref:YhcN/YlaJ family sporulation lipoprotein n=1 Tax=Alkalibacillus haloalkaliphilus TaxID=94136 RepID=UPI002935EDD4|nr:YhcN/YlaJ family sporulation lipoprotein [Alkalibacillus haloalkaliphilus]MDV2582270.1 YhcN/YlaJ family sporulation lipoprotein [Alkalibacillus haloalkaliphilus]
MRYKLLTITALTFLLMTACAQQGQNNQNLNDDINNDHIIQVRDSEIEQDRQHTNMEAAERLSRIASDVNEVQRATAVVFGSYTVVGIDVTDDLDRSRVGSVKYTVAEAIKDDPYGHYAFVMADGDVVSRLNEINRGIQEGRARHVIVDEIANLVGRYVPETPPTDQRPNASYEERIENEQERQEQEFDHEVDPEEIESN